MILFLGFCYYAWLLLAVVGFFSAGQPTAALTVIALAGGLEAQRAHISGLKDRIHHAERRVALLERSGSEASNEIDGVIEAVLGIIRILLSMPGSSDKDTETLRAHMKTLKRGGF